MSINEKTILTKEGYNKLQEELELLKNEKRADLAERIKIAISFGDLSENSEYEDAKNEQAHLEGRIADLEQKLRNVDIIEEDADNKKVKLGSTVIIKNLETEVETQVTIVGSMEFDPDSFKISNESPVGKAVLGKKLKDEFSVKLPNGKMNYQVIKILKN